MRHTSAPGRAVPQRLHRRQGWKPGAYCGPGRAAVVAASEDAEGPWAAEELSGRDVDGRRIARRRLVGRCGGAGPRRAGTSSSDVKKRFSRRSEVGVQVAPPSTLVKMRSKNATRFSLLKLSANSTPAAGSTTSPSTLGGAPSPLSRAVQVAPPSTASPHAAVDGIEDARVARIDDDRRNGSASPTRRANRRPLFAAVQTLEHGAAESRSVERTRRARDPASRLRTSVRAAATSVPDRGSGTSRLRTTWAAAQQSRRAG